MDLWNGGKRLLASFANMIFPSMSERKQHRTVSCLPTDLIVTLDRDQADYLLGVLAPEMNFLREKINDVGQREYLMAPLRNACSIQEQIQSQIDEINGL